jgi:hypothetical protein
VIWTGLIRRMKRIGGPYLRDSKPSGCIKCWESLEYGFLSRRAQRS